MKIVIDISPLKSKHKTRGIGIYTRRLIESIKKIDKQNEYLLTTKTRDINDVDIVHYPYFDLFFHTLPVKKFTKTIVTIHDVIPLIYPKKFPPGIKGKIKYYIQRYALKNIDAVITDSNNSKRDIIQYLNIPKNKVHTVYLAADEVFYKDNKKNLQKIKNKYVLPDEFILYVGDLNYNKNLPNLIKAFTFVSEKYKNLYLLMVGKAFSDNKLAELNELKKLINQYNLEEKIVMKSNIPLDPSYELAVIYKLASMYIQPSFYEGFGLPILEAFASGIPVIASNKSSIPEIVGKSAILVNPRSIQDIVRGINQVLNLSQEEKNKLIKSAKLQARKFSWEKTAKETIAVYKKVLKE